MTINQPRHQTFHIRVELSASHQQTKHVHNRFRAFQFINELIYVIVGDLQYLKYVYIFETTFF